MPDVLVLGGGPAASAAAILVARDRGLDVVVVAARASPRPGETLHPGAEALFDRLGVTAAIDAMAPIRHPGHRVVWGDRASEERFGAERGEAWRGYQLEGPALDATLAAEARRVGVRWIEGTARVDREGTGWRVTTDDASLVAPWLVDATGRRRVLAQRLRLPVRRVGPVRVVHWGHVRGELDELGELPVLRGTRDAWTWLARVRDRRIAWSRVFRDRRRRDARPELLRDLPPDGADGAADATSSIVDDAAGPGYFVVGDAAARLDPLSSHGVLRALMSGMMAAHVLGAPDGAEAYRGWLRTWFDADHARLASFYDELGW